MSNSLNDQQRQEVKNMLEQLKHLHLVSMSMSQIWMRGNDDLANYRFRLDKYNQYMEEMAGVMEFLYDLTQS